MKHGIELCVVSFFPEPQVIKRDPFGIAMLIEQSDVDNYAIFFVGI